MEPTCPIIPGLSSFPINSMYLSGTTSKSKPMASTSRGCIFGPLKVPLTKFSPSPPSRRSTTRLV
jgi:hypothetical protein